jgi:hypothetical protein
MSQSVAVVTGRLFRGSEMSLPAQAVAEDAVRTAATAVLKQQNICSLYGALACGVDIIVAEAALDLGISFHAALPFALVHFVKRSVDIGDPPGSPGLWRARFEAALPRATSLAIAEDAEPLERDLDGYFHYGFRFMAGLALMHARAVGAECRLIAVTDVRAPGDIASSSRAAADWRAAGRALDLIKLPASGDRGAPRPHRDSAFRPCVYLWDSSGHRVDHLAGAVLSGIGASVALPASRAGGAGICVVVDGIDAAIRIAGAAVASVGPLRTLCDFGLVLGADLQPDARTIVARAAASTMPRLPAGPLATLSFAAQAVTELGDRLDIREAGGMGEGLALYRFRLQENA